MKKLVYIVVSLFLLSLNLYSIPGYTWQNPIAKFTGVQMFDTLNFIICGQDGRLIRTNDCGKTFEWIETNTRDAFMDVKFKDKVKGAVITNTGNIIITEDSCKSWKTYKISNEALNCIELSGANTIFVCGIEGIFKSIDFGRTWNNVYHKTGISIKDITFPSQIIGFACGNGGTMIKSTDRGESWEEIMPIISQNDFQSIDFYDDNYGLACYEDTSLYDNGFNFIKTQDGGNLWETISINARRPMYTKVFNQKESIAIGGEGVVIRTEDFWKTMSIDTMTRFHLYPFLYAYRGEMQFDISSDSEGNIISIGNENSICVLKNKGKEKKLIKWMFMGGIYGVYTAIFFDIHNTNENHLILGTSSSIISESFDNGVSWIHSYPNELSYNTQADLLYVGSVVNRSARISDFFFKDKNTGMGLGFRKNSLCESKFITTDGAVSWDTLNNVTALPKASIKNQFGISLNNADPPFSFYTTIDGGINWKKTIHNININTKNESFLDVTVINDSSGFILLSQQGVPTDDTIHYPFKSKTIYKFLKTTNYGQTFDTLYQEGNWYRGFYRFKFINENNGYLLGWGNQIIETRDGGFSWNSIDCPLYFKYDLHFINDNYVIVVGVKDSIAYSTDNMKTWTIEKLPMFQDHFGLTWSSSFERIIPMGNGDLFLTGPSRVIKLVKNDTTTGICDPKIEVRYNPYFFIQITPHPVISQCTVTLYGLYSVKNQPLSVKIYDIFGNMVKDVSGLASSSNDGAKSTFEINTESLPMGIYFLQLLSGGYGKTEKFVKL